MGAGRCVWCGAKTRGVACSRHADLEPAAPTSRGRGARRGLGAVADERRRRRGQFLTERAREQLDRE